MLRLFALRRSYTRSPGTQFSVPELRSRTVAGETGDPAPTLQNGRSVLFVRQSRALPVGVNIGRLRLETNRLERVLTTQQDDLFCGPAAIHPSGREGPGAVVALSQSAADFGLCPAGHAARCACALPHCEPVDCENGSRNARNPKTTGTPLRRPLEEK